jgi:hypothetical protein
MRDDEAALEAVARTPSDLRQKAQLDEHVNKKYRETRAALQEHQAYLI